LRRTVPLLKCTRLEGILVKKLNSASDPTAMIGGTRKTKISRGSKRTPPPSPVMPIRVPTTKPIKTLSAMSIATCSYLRGSCIRVDPDKALSLQVKNDLLGGFLGTHVGGVNHDLGVLRCLVRIGNPGELFQDSGARFGVQPFAVTQ